MTTLSTHDTKRGEDVRARLAVLAEIPERVGGGARPAARRWRPLPDPGFGEPALAGRRSAPGRLAASGCTPTPRRRCARPATAPRWTDAGRGFEAAVHAAGRRGVRRRARCARCSTRLRRPRSRRPAGATRWPRSCSRSRCPACRRLPGQRAVGAVAWSTPTTGARSTSTQRARAARPRLDGGRRARRVDDDRARPSCWCTRGRCGCAATGPSCSPAYAPLAGDRRGRRPRRSPSTAAARSPSRPGCRVGLAAPRRLGRHRRCALPRRHAGATCSPGRTLEVAGGARGWPTCSRDCPVALLVQGGRMTAARPFDVWAPRARAACGCRSATRTVDDGPRRGRLVDARRRRCREGEVDYGFLLDDDDTPRPDPRSRRQPDGRARALAHLRPGGVRVDRRRLDRPPAGRRRDLRAARRHVHPRGHPRRRDRPARPPRRLGVDLVELLPVNAFNGTHNWGYDGVLWFAVHEAYGGPAAYQRFVDACHAAGLGVVQDVVYNHLGPSGNYLPLFGPYLKAGAQHLGRPGQPRRRGLGARCAATSSTTSRMWLRDFHVDGLRLDAVHALVDDVADVHLLEEMADRGRRAVGRTCGRPLTLIAESDLNDPRLVTPARGRRLRARRAVERRLPPRAARRADRRDRRATTPTSSRSSALAKVCEHGLLPRRHVLVVPRPRPRRAGRHRARCPAWRLVVVQPEPRPDRQPRRRRPAHRGTSTTTSSPAPRC